jgi:RNA polymerase sigma-70 factor (ECF subfamily)
VAAGDDVALRELFTRHAPWLAARLRSALPPADVEDVLQETFLAVWRAARAYQPSGTAGGVAMDHRPPSGRTVAEVQKDSYT